MLAKYTTYYAQNYACILALPNQEYNELARRLENSKQIRASETQILDLQDRQQF